MNQELAKQFHEKFGLTVNNTPTVPSLVDSILRYTLIKEELEELNSGLVHCDIVEIADAVADLLYVVYGTAVTCGLNADELFREVHRSNMSKLWEDGTVHRREDGKILKPPTYSPADIKGILQ